MLGALLKRLRFAFTGRPEEMRRRRRGVSQAKIEDAGRPKNFNWQGAGNGALGPENGYGAMGMSDVQQRVELQHDLLRDILASVLTSTVAAQYGEMPLSVALNSGDEQVFGHATMHLGRLGNEVRNLPVKDERFLGDALLQMRNEAGSSNLSPNMVGVPLLRRVLTTGSPDEAIEWLGRMLTTKDASGKTIEALWGVPVEAEVQLLPDLKIVPIEQLPDSSKKRLLMNNAPPERIRLKPADSSVTHHPTGRIEASARSVARPQVAQTRTGSLRFTL